MKFFKKKKQKDNYKVLSGNYVHAQLPSLGYELENYVPSDYPGNDPDIIRAAYSSVGDELQCIIQSSDVHSCGTECDSYITAQMKHMYATHEAVIANTESQIARIFAARETRKAELKRKIDPLQAKIDKLKSEIGPLTGLEAQFRIRIGHFSISVGLPITIIAMMVDAAVNYNFLQTVLLSNAALLLITVICMSVCSDACMWGLATYLNHREQNFTHKPVFWAVCSGLMSAFLPSVVASFMIRYGSMDASYGTINASGEFVAKESYSLAEYGVTMITAFVTTATGIMSFAFSLDKNAFRIAIRERKKKELEGCLATLAPLQNELSLIEHAPDLCEWDAQKRTAAEHQLEALSIGLKFHCRKLMAEQVKDADFSERMAASGEKLLSESAHVVCTPTSDSTNSACTNISLDKVS